MKVLTYAADVISIVNGGLGIQASDAPATGVTTWVDYPTQTLEMKHGEGMAVTFNLTVPKGTAPGQYLTILVIQNADPIKGTGSGSDGVAINQILRQGVAVAITVPGDADAAMEVGAVSYKDNPVTDSVLIDVKNTGHLHLTPTGNVQIVDSTGATVLDTPVTMGKVYTGTETQIEIGLTKPLADGTYTATVALTDPDTGVQASEADVAFDVVATETVSTAPATVDSLTVTPVRSVTMGPVQVANVAATITNPGATISNGQLILHVERDGQLVEDYPLTPPGEIAPGPMQFQQRYLPLSGWVAGSYSFSVRIVSVDPATGKTTDLGGSESPVVVDIQ